VIDFGDILELENLRVAGLKQGEHPDEKASAPKPSFLLRRAVLVSGTQESRLVRRFNHDNNCCSNKYHGP
jgi:hypothetical protein